MKIGVPHETSPGECRVAIVPETVKRLAAKKIQFVVQAAAGEESYFSDDDYKAAGATIAATPDELYASVDAIVKVQKPDPDEVAKLKEGSTLVSFLYPLSNASLVKSIAARKVTAISVDMIPRTTLAQSMDAL